MSEGYAYFYENVGIFGIPSKDSYAYFYENVGIPGYMRWNVGAVLFPRFWIKDSTQYWYENVIE